MVIGNKSNFIKMSPSGKNPAKVALQEKAEASFKCGRALVITGLPSVKRLGFYLTLFAIELSLKRLIIGHDRFKGTKDSQVRYVFTNKVNNDIFGDSGHNLVSMYDFASKEKIIHTSENDRLVIAQNNNEYIKSDLRYYAGINDIFGTGINHKSYNVLKDFYLHISQIS